MTCDLWHVNVAVCDCILKRTSHTAVLFAMYFPPVFPHKQSFFEVRTPQHIKGIRQSIVSHIKLCYSRNISLDSVMSRLAHSCRIDVDCEQSLLVGSAWARERWAAKPRDARNEGGNPRRKKRDRLHSQTQRNTRRASPVSRLQSRAWSFACLRRFDRRTKPSEKLWSNKALCDLR